LKLKPIIVSAIITSSFVCGSCTFVYNENQSEEYNYPNVTMEDLTYVRMEDGKLSAKLEAESADRYEKKHSMELSNYTFEQYNENEEVDSYGKGGAAVVELSTNNVLMTNDVEINVGTEGMVLKGEDLTWKDSAKTLTSNEDSKVNIKDKDGSEVTGNGFAANIRPREWSFKSDVDGSYLFEEDEAHEQEIEAENTNFNE